MKTPLSPDLLLHAYQNGVFPMADPDEENAVYWYRPEWRGILPLEAFKVPKNVAKLVRRGPFEVVVDRAFEAVMRACADRPSTWISEEIIEAYTALHALGFAHSVECWQDEALVGGLYGIALRGAFFGESMFHRVSNASKVALVHLVERLRAGGFVLLDTQYPTPHLKQFGIREISAVDYRRCLDEALRIQATW